MKNVLVFIALLVFLSCLKNAKNTEEANEKIENKLTGNCNLENILLLTHKEQEIIFFQKLDSLVLKQYPEGKEAIDITPELLSRFLSDLEINNLKNDSVFRKKYIVKLTPESLETFHESNNIELMYFPKDCAYRLSVNNYYETKEYADEGSVSYSFKIENGSIKDFKRQEAG